MSEQGCIAVVTGGIQELGAATCRKLGALGLNVIATHLGRGAGCLRKHPAPPLAQRTRRAMQESRGQLLR